MAANLPIEWMRRHRGQLREALERMRAGRLRTVDAGVDTTDESAKYIERAIAELDAAIASAAIKSWQPAW
jgi:hypothetical protein